MKQGGSTALRVPARTGTGTLSTAMGVCHVTAPPGRRWGGSCHSRQRHRGVSLLRPQSRAGGSWPFLERKESLHSSSPRPARALFALPGLPRVPEATGPAPHGQKAGRAEGVPLWGGRGLDEEVRPFGLRK